jgi:hypothetical protein
LPFGNLLGEVILQTTQRIDQMITVRAGDRVIIGATRGESEVVAVALRATKVEKVAHFRRLARCLRLGGASACAHQESFVIAQSVPWISRCSF